MNHIRTYNESITEQGGLMMYKSDGTPLKTRKTIQWQDGPDEGTEQDIMNILNIAGDEGLDVYYRYTPDGIIIKIIENGDNFKFKEIVKNILNRIIGLDIFTDYSPCVNIEALRSNIYTTQTKNSFFSLLSSDNWLWSTSIEFSKTIIPLSRKKANKYIM